MRMTEDGAGAPARYPEPGAPPPPPTAQPPARAHPARAGPAAPESCPPPCRERERETEAARSPQTGPGAAGVGLRIHN